MTWERKGECNHCGFCCLFLSVEPHIVAFQKEEMLDKNGGFDEAHAKVRGLVSEPDGTMVVPTWLYSPCSAFSKEELRCGIQETKPEICKDYPWIPEQVVGTPCSYHFEKYENTTDTVYRQGGQSSPYPGRSAERGGHILRDESPYFNVPYPIITTQSLLNDWHRMKIEENTHATNGIQAIPQDSAPLS